jgi:hypothetical protein
MRDWFMLTEWVTEPSRIQLARDGKAAIADGDFEGLLIEQNLGRSGGDARPGSLEEVGRLEQLSAEHSGIIGSLASPSRKHLAIRQQQRNGVIAPIVSLINHLRPGTGHRIPKFRRVNGVSWGYIAEAIPLGASSHQNGTIRQHSSVVLTAPERHAFS